MQVRLTGSARTQLLDEVASLARRDRRGAAALVDSIEDVALELASGRTEGHEVDLGKAAFLSGDRHRLYYQVRGDILWIVALWRGPAALDSGW